MAAFLKQLILAVFDDGFSGDQADEGTVVIDHGNKVLIGCPFDQILHGGGDPYGNIILPPGDFHDPAAFCLPHIHVAHIFHGPEQVALFQGAPVFSLPVQNRYGRITGHFHFFNGLPDGIIIVKK